MYFMWGSYSGTATGSECSGLLILILAVYMSVLWVLHLMISFRVQFKMLGLTYLQAAMEITLHRRCRGMCKNML